MWSELKRVLPWLIVILVSFLWLDQEALQIKAQLYRLSMVALVVVLIHIGRKMLFPYLKFEQAVTKISESATALALLVFGLFIFLSVILWVSVVR